MRTMRRALVVVAVGLMVACVDRGSSRSTAVQPLASMAPRAASPLTLPLLQNLSAVTVGPAFTFDWPDGAGGDISYGPGVVGVSEDGTRLYLGCNLVTQGQIAQIAIPANGGRAKVVAPCAGVTRAEVEKIMRGYGTAGWSWDAGARMLGGVLEQGGRVCVTAYGSYDANSQAVRSHWCGPDLQHLSGPYGGLLANAGPAGAAVAAGLVKSQMGRIPPEWQADLGGPAFSTAGYASIIRRGSYGAAFSVFDPKAVTADGFPMTMLLGCPHDVPSCVTYGTPTSNSYNGSELSGGAFIVPGTRTLAVIEREASGPTCYGYATRVQADHGKPYLDAVYCYSLSDPLNEKGPKGYPYRLVAKLYDLADLVAVRKGQKKPWDVKQYATLDMPGSSANEVVGGGAFNEVTGEFYLLRHLGGGVNTVYSYRGFGAAPPPPPPPPPPVDRDCDGTWARVPGSETACVDVQGVGQRTYQEAFTKTVDQSGNGLACPASPRTGSEACALPPPPSPPQPVTCTGTVVPGQPFTLTCRPTGAPAPAPTQTDLVYLPSESYPQPTARLEDTWFCTALGGPPGVNTCTNLGTGIQVRQ